MCHRSETVNILRKNFHFKYQKFDRSGPVELRLIMLEYIKCATGPSLWIFWEKTFILKYQKCDRSGPVELREKMLEYIKCATGPDLWIFWEKTFVFKYQKCDRSGPVELREKMLEYIKYATGPDLWHILYILAFFHVIPQIFSRNSTGPDLSHFWYLKTKVFSQNNHRSEKLIDISVSLRNVYLLDIRQHIRTMFDIVPDSWCYPSGGANCAVLPPITHAVLLW